MKNNSAFAKKTLVHLVLDALFAALFVILSTFLSFKVLTLEISWASLPILLCAVLLTPADAVAVALCGSFFEQLFSPYGMSATAPLWMLPVILQALFASLFFRLCRGKQKTWKMIAVIFASEVLLTAANIGVSFFDAWLFDYLAYLTVDIPLRFLNGGVRAVLSSAVIPFLLPPLRKALSRAGIISAAGECTNPEIQ